MLAAVVLTGSGAEPAKAADVSIVLTEQGFDQIVVLDPTDAAFGSNGDTTAIQAGNACSWCTDTVDLCRPRHQLTLHGGQIYKARWWLDPRR